MSKGLRIDQEKKNATVLYFRHFRFSFSWLFMVFGTLDVPDHRVNSAGKDLQHHSQVVQLFLRSILRTAQSGFVQGKTHREKTWKGNIILLALILKPYGFLQQFSMKIVKPNPLILWWSSLGDSHDISFSCAASSRISPLFLADSKLSHEGFERYFKWPASQAVPDTLAAGFGCFCQSPQPQAPGPIQMPCRDWPSSTFDGLWILSVRDHTENRSRSWWSVIKICAATLSVPCKCPATRNWHRWTGVAGCPGRLVFSQAQASPLATATSNSPSSPKKEGGQHGANEFFVNYLWILWEI